MNPLAISQKMSSNQIGEEAAAQEFLRPIVEGSLTTRAFRAPSEKVDVEALVLELPEHMKKLNGGDLGQAEAMLMVQAQALDSIFNRLAQIVAQRINGNGNIQGTEIFLRLALKAQNQCRATVETLANITKPPVVYAQQTNIANGPQQINNDSRKV